jgi:hypothetical protein
MVSGWWHSAALPQLGMRCPSGAAFQAAKTAFKRAFGHWQNTPETPARKQSLQVANLLHYDAIFAAHKESKIW